MVSALEGMDSMDGLFPSGVVMEMLDAWVVWREGDLGADLGNEGKVIVDSVERLDSAAEGAILDGVAGRTSEPALTICKDSLSISAVSIDSAVGNDGVGGYSRTTSYPRLAVVPDTIESVSSRPE